MLTQGNCFKLSRERRRREVEEEEEEGGGQAARREFERLSVLCEGKIDCIHQMFFNGCFIDEELK